MRTELEKRFFEAFELGGVADSCLRLVIDRMEQDSKPDQWERAEEERIKRIVEVTEAFDFSIVNLHRKAPIFQEIEANLRELTGKQRESYLYSLLTPFGDWVRIARGRADKYETEWSKEHLRQQAEQLFNILNGDYQKGTIERAMQMWESAVIHYSNRLDAILLQEGEDLLSLQEITGVKLIDYRDLSALDFYCGNIGITGKYLADLNPIPQPDTLTPVITEMVIDTSTGATGTAPEWWEKYPELDTPKARLYVNRAIERGFIKQTTTGLEWIRAKREGEGYNTLIALFFGMIYCGDEIITSRYGDKWKLGDGGFFPDIKLRRLLGVKTLGVIRTNNLDSSRCKTAPRGWEDIVNLFEK